VDGRCLSQMVSHADDCLLTFAKADGWARNGSVDCDGMPYAAIHRECECIDRKVNWVSPWHPTCYRYLLLMEHLAQCLARAGEPHTVRQVLQLRFR
jgi:hypothetical protein